MECDVRLTADGRLVCVHDRTTGRTSSGNLVVSRSTFDQLDQLDYARGVKGPACGKGERANKHSGSWHTTGDLHSSADPANAPQARLLSLEALLELALSFRSRPVTLFIETKHPVRQAGRLELALTRALARFGLLHPAESDQPPVVVMSFSALAVRRLGQEAPRLPRVYLAESTRQLLGPTARFARANVLGPSVRLLRARPELAAQAARRGLPVYCWTVDEAADVELCQELGVRWIATNWPGRTRELLGAPDAPSTRT